jgi:hypothetical protein
MADPTPPGTPGDLNSQPKDIVEVLKFLAEQAEANRNVLNAQAKEDRELFKHILWIVSIPLIIVLGVAGFFGINDWISLDKKANASMQETSAQASRVMEKTQKETEDALAEQKQKNDKVLGDLKTEDQELGRAEIAKADKTLRDKFSDPNMQKTLDNAATGAINDRIEKKIDDKVDKKLKETSDKVDKESHEVIDKANKTLERTEAEAKKSSDLITRYYLLTVPNLDDAKSFDELLKLRDSGTMEERTDVSKRVEAMRESTRNQLSLRITKGPCLGSAYDLDGLFGSLDVPRRRNAIANCSSILSPDATNRQDLNSFGTSPQRLIELAGLPDILLDIAKQDPSLPVRAQAVNTINKAFGGTNLGTNSDFDPLKTAGLDVLVEKSKPNYQARVLLPLYNKHKDSLWLYRTFQGLKEKVDSTLKKQVEEATETMLNASGCKTLEHEAPPVDGNGKYCLHAMDVIEDADRAISREGVWNPSDTDLDSLRACGLNKQQFDELSEEPLPDKTVTIRQRCVLELVLNQYDQGHRKLY